jgi:iron complex outermembrane recepter protein
MNNIKHDSVRCVMLTVATVALVTGWLLCHLPCAIADVLADDPASVRAIVLSQAGNGQDVADMDITQLVKVRVSPFDVSSFLDKGYRASNSISGSRFDTPIRELPFAIQAFTESFIEDQKPANIFDIARYSPGVTYRSNDFNEGNANLSASVALPSAPPRAMSRYCATVSMAPRSSTSPTSPGWR